MRRIKLRIDDLQVDSFRTMPTGPGTGTVWGYGQDGDPPFNTVGNIPTCEPCDASNQATCDTCQGDNCKNDTAA